MKIFANFQVQSFRGSLEYFLTNNLHDYGHYWIYSPVGGRPPPGPPVFPAPAPTIAPATTVIPPSTILG